MSHSGSTHPIFRTIPDRSFTSRLKRWWRGTDVYDGIGTAAPSGIERNPPAPITINIPPQGVHDLQGGYSGRPGTGFIPVIPSWDNVRPVIPDIRRFEDEPQRQQGGPYVYQPGRSPPPQPYIPSRYSDDSTPSPIVLVPPPLQQGDPYIYQPGRSPPPQPYIPSRYSDDRTPSPIVLVPPPLQQGDPYVYQPGWSPPPQPYIPSRYSDDRTPSPIVLGPPPLQQQPGIMIPPPITRVTHRIESRTPSRSRSSDTYQPWYPPMVVQAYRGRSRSRSSSYDRHPPVILPDPHPLSYGMPITPAPVTNVIHRSESLRTSRSSFREPQIAQVPSLAYVPAYSDNERRPAVLRKSKRIPSRRSYHSRSPRSRSPPPIVIAERGASSGRPYGPSYGAPYGPGYGAPESLNGRSHSTSNRPRSPNYEQPDVRSRQPVTPRQRRTSPPPIVVQPQSPNYEQPDVRSRRHITPRRRRTLPPPIVVEPRSQSYERPDSRLSQPVIPPPVFVEGSAALVQPPRGRRYERPDGSSRQGGVLAVPPPQSPNYGRPNTRSRPPATLPMPVIVGEPSFERLLDSRSRRPLTPVIPSDLSQPPSRGRHSSRTRPVVISGQQDRRTFSQPGVVVAGGYMSQPTITRPPENREKTSRPVVFMTG
jgi:hypothetical protein